MIKWMILLQALLVTWHVKTPLEFSKIVPHHPKSRIILQANSLMITIVYAWVVSRDLVYMIGKVYLIL